MDERLNIATTIDMYNFKDRLERDFGLMRQHGLDIDYRTGCFEEFNTIDCSIAVDQKSVIKHDQLALCRHYIAEAIADLIIEEWQNTFLKAAISENYSCFSASEKARIHKLAMQILKESGIEFTRNSKFLNQKEKICYEVSKFLESNNVFNIDGFINFRLKGYKEELREIADEAVDEYLLEKEFDDFINLLKYFVEIQEPVVDKINVVARSSGSFELLDENYVKVENKHIDDLKQDQVDGELSEDDLLISALITLAPSEVVIHSPSIMSISTIVNTIERVFEGGVTICSGCQECLSLNQRKS